MSKLIETRGLTKQYPGVVALDHVDFDLEPGEVHVLFGENGAGKSTLISMLAGANTPTEGSIRLNGEIVSFDSVAQAQAKGIYTVFQEFSLIPTLTVAQNIFLGGELRRGPFLDHRAMRARSREMLEELGFDIDPSAIVARLSRAQQQMVEITKAFHGDLKVLILDEPTAGVDIELRRSMWEFMQQINIEEKTTIILTTHYLEEAEQLCKRIAILDHGEIRINTEMKDLLAQLSVETFVFDLETPLTQPLELDGVTGLSQPDEQTLEVTLTEGESLNGVFNQLSAQGITVASMRNKANRLEELFMRLVEKNIQSADSMKEAGL